MPPMLRNPRGPEGRNNQPNHRPGLNRSSRQDAGVDGVSAFLGRAAGRGVEAQT